jgi:stress response protein YsnF
LLHEPHAPLVALRVQALPARPEISSEEHEVVLHEEEPVVEKRVVPKERVRMEKEQVTDEAQISETVRKEQIEAEGETGR